MSFDIMAEIRTPDWNALAGRVVADELRAFPIPAAAPDQHDAIGIYVPSTLAEEDYCDRLIRFLEDLLSEGAILWDLYSGQQISVEKLPELRLRLLEHQSVDSLE